MHARLVGRALPLVMAAALVMAACGDDSSKAASTTAAAGPTTAGPTTVPAPTTVAGPSHAPFKVMVASDFTSPTLPVPEAVAAAKVALQGIDGLQIESCDTKGDMNATSACERQAVSDGVVAVVHTLGGMSVDHSILTQAKIPIIGSVQETQPNAFAVSSGLGAFAAIGVGMANAGCKTIATIYREVGSDFLPNVIKSGAEQSGAKEVARASIPTDAPDVSAPVAKVLDANPDCIALAVAPATVVQVMTAIGQSGKKPTIAGPAAIFPPDVLKALGPLAEGILIPGVALDPADPAPVMGQIRTAMAAIDSSAKLTNTAVLTWASAKILAAALNTIDGPVTAAQVQDALMGLRDVDLDGVIHSFSSIELASPIAKRAFNHYAINYKITNGTPTRVGDFYDLKSVIEGVKLS